MSDLVQADKLRLLIERIERLESDKKDVADDIKDVYLEVKSHGYEAKIVRQICLLYTSPSPRDRQKSRMPSSA